MARYELNEADGGWLDTTKPCGADGGMREAEDGQEELFACAEEYEVVEYMNTLEAELRTLREDKERLDWIDQNMDCDLAGPGLHVRSVDTGDDQTLREAIDAAKEKT